MQTVLCIAPVLVTLLALGFGVRSMYSALLGVLAALLAASIGFPIALAGLPTTLVRWGPILTEVLAIIGGGLLLSEVLRNAGAQAELANWVKSRAGSGVGAVLLVVHGITPFAESLTGFGIGITIGIPLLANFGLTPRNVVVIGLLGLCTIPWGSMGPGTMIAAKMADLPFHDLGVSSGFVSLVPLVVTGVVAAWLVALPGARAGAAVKGVLSGAALTLAITAFNSVFGTSAAGALGSLVIILVHFVKTAKISASPLTGAARRALASYVVLLAGVLIGGWLGRMAELPYVLRVIASPAPWLIVATFFFTRGVPSIQSRRRAWASWLQVAPVTGLFIVLGMVMTISGMATYLAQVISQSGRAYLAIAPFVGAMGGLITGSNAGANAMFAATQAEIARSLGVSVLWFMAIHNVAAAFMMMASPGKIEMAMQLAHSDAQQYRRWAQRMLLGVAFVVVTLLAISSMVIFN